MAVARNDIDFRLWPFVQGPNGAYYVEPHSAFREFPVFRFPGGMPLPGAIVSVHVKVDTRLSENQFSERARAHGRGIGEPMPVQENPGTLVHRAVVRVKRLDENTSRFRLTLDNPGHECKRWAWGAFVLYLAVGA